jgi:erythromycin esterase-like protein
MRIARPALAALLLWPVLALGAGAQAPSSPEPQAARRPPRPVGYPVLPGIWSLSGNDPGLATGDLAPLQGIVGNATVVGLGEAVHTSGGFYRMKHRILRYLVETMGFRAFAIESPWIAADSVAAYVQTCEGTPEDAMKGLFSVWQSTEVRDMVQWMCEWNRSHRKAKDKVSFFGFDIQQPQDDKPALAAFLARISADPSLAGGLGDCSGSTSDLISDAAYAGCTEGLQRIDAYFQQSSAAIVLQTSEQDLAIAELNLTGLRAWEDEDYAFQHGHSAQVTDARDAGMAYAFGALRALRTGNARTVLWAHNFHIAKGMMGGGNTMGSVLAGSLGSSYVSLALVADEMSIDWVGVGCGLADPPYRDSVEDLLHALGKPALLVDLSFPGTSDPYIPPGSRGLGYYVLDPRQHYDGVVYQDVSPKMTPLFRPAACQ